jgi:histidinol-phosphate aminotransferase
MTLRLHLNENTAGCSPAVLAALRAFGRTDAAFYPDYGPVTAAVARWFGVPARWVLPTNGLDEGLLVTAHAAARGSPGANVIIVEPAFEMYAAFADAAGLREAHIAPAADFTFPAERIVAAVSARTRLVNLTDPNNPTGLSIPAGAVERIACAAPQAIVLVDEAYADFSGRTSIGTLLDRYRNVVVGRSFAKAHGLAGLRAGALVAHPDTLAAIQPQVPPYSLNACAARALEAALEDRAYLDWYVAESARSRELIYDFCASRRLPFWRSEANFVLVRAGGRAAAWTDAMAARGVLVRDRSHLPGCEGCIRVTAGIADHTRAGLATLEDVHASRPD